METAAEPTKVMSTEQAARRLGISAHSLRKLDIPAARYSGRIFYRVTDIDSFIDNHVVEAA